MNGLTNRQEAFAQAVASGTTQSDAYRLAYRPRSMKAKSVHEKASHILATGKVRARVKHLQDLVMEKLVRQVAIDKAWITRQLVHIVEKGLASGSNLNAANRALELLGKDLGMFVDRGMVVKDPLDELTHDQLKQLMEALGEEQNS